MYHVGKDELREGAIKQAIRELAISDTGLLPTILAQHLFTSFMWTIVEQLSDDFFRQGFANSEQEVEIEAGVIHVRLRDVREL